jgi:hypothetical protein
VHSEPNGGNRACHSRYNKPIDPPASPPSRASHALVSLTSDIRLRYL